MDNSFKKFTFFLVPTSVFGFNFFPDASFFAEAEAVLPAACCFFVEEDVAKLVDSEDLGGFAAAGVDGAEDGADFAFEVTSTERGVDVAFDLLTAAMSLVLLDLCFLSNNADTLLGVVICLAFAALGVAGGVSSGAVEGGSGGGRGDRDFFVCFFRILFRLMASAPTLS